MPDGTFISGHFTSCFGQLKSAQGIFELKKDVVFLGYLTMLLGGLPMDDPIVAYLHESRIAKAACPKFECHVRSYMHRYVLEGLKCICVWIQMNQTGRRASSGNRGISQNGSVGLLE